MVKEIIKDRHGRKIGTIETDSRGKQTIRDEHFKKLATIETDSSGKQKLRDERFRVIGTYDPGLDVTKDEHFRRVGKGNQLLSMVFGLQLDD